MGCESREVETPRPAPPRTKQTAADVGEHLRPWRKLFELTRKQAAERTGTARPRRGASRTWERGVKRQLEDANSPLRQFFAEHLPDTSALREDWRNAVSDPPTPVERSGGPPDVIGQAASLAITAAFDPSIPEPVLAGVATAAQLGWVDTATSDEFEVELGVALERRNEDLYPLAVVATWFEQIFRAGARPAHPFATLDGGGLTDLTQLVDGSWCEEIAELDRVAADTLGHLHEAGTAIAGPTFDGSDDVGGADADLICGGALLEVKAGAGLNLRQRDIHQLVTYALLDRTDRYEIGEVGFYQARYGSLVTWPVEHALTLLAGRPVEVQALRAALGASLRTDR